MLDVNELSYKIITSYALLCLVLHYIWTSISHLIIPKFRDLSIELQNVWYNKGVSTIHAIVMFSGASYYWINHNPTIDINKTIDAQHVCLLLYFMLGYLVYDTIYELTHTKQIDILIHHIIGGISHLSVLYTLNNSALFYCLVIFMAEASTPFLNISWLLHQLKIQDSLLYQACLFLLPLTFFIFRVILGPSTVYHLFYYKQTWGTTSLDIYMWLGNTIIIMLFSILNIFWFYKLLQIALGSKKKKKST